MRQRAPKQTLPRPVAMHHMVEDFLTLWDGPHTHLAPLRHFLDHVTAADLRSRFAQPCFMESMTNREPSAMCNDQFMQGQGMTAMPDMIAAIEGPRISTVWEQPERRKALTTVFVWSLCWVIFVISCFVLFCFVLSGKGGLMRKTVLTK